MKRDGTSPMRTTGSLSLCRSLLGSGLVDRVRLVVFPVITGKNGYEVVGLVRIPGSLAWSNGGPFGDDFRPYKVALVLTDSETVSRSDTPAMQFACWKRVRDAFDLHLSATRITSGA